MFIYESHLGDLFTSDCELSYEQTYCEICGDSDRRVGEAETRGEALELLKDDVDIDGSGGWDKEYIEQFLMENWEE